MKYLLTCLVLVLIHLELALAAEPNDHLYRIPRKPTYSLSAEELKVLEEIYQLRNSQRNNLFFEHRIMFSNRFMLNQEIKDFASKQKKKSNPKHFDKTSRFIDRVWLKIDMHPDELGKLRSRLLRFYWNDITLFYDILFQLVDRFARELMPEFKSIVQDAKDRKFLAFLEEIDNYHALVNTDPNIKISMGLSFEEFLLLVNHELALLEDINNSPSKKGLIGRRQRQNYHYERALMLHAMRTGYSLESAQFLLDSQLNKESSMRDPATIKRIEGLISSFKRFKDVKEFFWSEMETSSSTTEPNSADCIGLLKYISHSE